MRIRGMASRQPRLNHKPVLPLSDRTIQRFWLKADRRGSNECWPWTSTINEKGYGRLGVNGRSANSVLAHRAAWAISNGRDPGALCVLHRCDNRRCVNPSHLFLGTVRDNWHDCIAKGRAVFPNPPKPHCRRGHPYTPQNTYFEVDGFRRCLECKRLRTKRSTLKRKERRHAARI